MAVSDQRAVLSSAMAETLALRLRRAWRFPGLCHCLCTDARRGQRLLLLLLRFTVCHCSLNGSACHGGHASLRVIRNQGGLRLLTRRQARKGQREKGQMWRA